MNKSIKPLPAYVLADMYAQLARLEKSGIPTTQALSLLAQAKNPSGQRAKVALAQLKRGKSLAMAGIQAGLFVGIEGELLKLADASGTHEAIYTQLARTYTEKASYLRKIKTRLIYPILLLILSIFLQPLPELIGGGLSLTQYLFATVGLMLKMAGFIFIVLRLPHWLKNIGFERLVDSLAIKLPYFGQWVIRQTMRDFFQALGLMLQAGLPILEALPKAYATVNNSIIKQQLKVISQRLQLGDEFAEALVYVENLPALAIPLISTGEYAGSLAEALLRYVTVESAEISLYHHQLAAWLPRLIYFLVVFWIVYAIVIGSDQMVPQLPEDL